jgi:hypothetical protein
MEHKAVLFFAGIIVALAIAGCVNDAQPAPYETPTVAPTATPTAISGDLPPLPPDVAGVSGQAADSELNELDSIMEDLDQGAIDESEIG